MSEEDGMVTRQANSLSIVRLLLKRLVDRSRASAAPLGDGGVISMLHDDLRNWDS
jgi:hypothetical protein